MGKSRDIETEAHGRILILDGAMGTMLQKEHLIEEDFRKNRFADFKESLKGCYDILVLTKPSLIKNIHLAFLTAGSDIIGTDTFNANRISLSNYGVSNHVKEINLEAVRIAREAVDDYQYLTRRHTWVAGKIGPTNIALSKAFGKNDSLSSGFSSIKEAIREQASALLEGGVDILLFETIFDSLSAQAALQGIQEARNQTGIRVPLMISVTLSREGRLFSGESVEEFLSTIGQYNPMSVGINCGYGPEGMENALRAIHLSPYLSSFHPSAGLPDETGRYIISPFEMAEKLKKYLDLKLVNIIGGCCGVTPEHIKAIATLLK